MHFNQLEDLLVHELEDLLSAEQMLADALPKMANAASNEKLEETFNKHLRETRENHITRLNNMFVMLGREPNSNHCKGMAGIIEEANEIIRSSGDPATKDAALIGAAQRAEHYEIAAYGTARAHAEELGHKKVAELLQETLDTEGDANKKLTKLAEGRFLRKGVNPVAAR
ncbi:MAG: ferritin-like domain-containing protein [Anaerolineae bacterium]|nr:ferritin-like domain-containing protein [Anaerolineae bacterium]